MTDQPVARPPKAPVYHLYLDDSGSRRLDRLAQSANEHPRWFALGGLLVAAEDVDACKSQYEDLFRAWPRLRRPLHISNMLAERQEHSWLQRLTDDERTRFWSDYRRFLTDLPVLGTACVVDRPGYHERGYATQAGAARWQLCRSAFDIVVERAAKFAAARGRRLRVRYEGSDKVSDGLIESYFAALKNGGLEFDEGRSAKYQPMAADGLKATLIDIERKDKRNRLMQVADTYVYAIARGQYDRKFDIYRRLLERRRLVNAVLTRDEAAILSIKHYCRKA